GDPGLGDALDLLQRGLDAVLDQLAQPLRRHVRAHRVGEDGGGADVHAAYFWQVGIAGQERLRLRDLVADFLDRAIQALAELELHRDAAGVLPRPGVHLVDTADAGDRVLQRLRHLRLDLTGAGALVHGGDEDDREG